MNLACLRRWEWVSPALITDSAIIGTVYLKLRYYLLSPLQPLPYWRMIWIRIKPGHCLGTRVLETISRWSGWTTVPFIRKMRRKKNFFNPCLGRVWEWKIKSSILNMLSFTFPLNTCVEMSSRILDMWVRNSKEMAEIVNWCYKLENYYYMELSRAMKLL